jgi:preprotein translocase SecE subunit
MAVAVKTTPEMTARDPRQLLLLGSLLGTAYVLFSFWLIFSGLPMLWRVLEVDKIFNEFLASALLLLVTVPVVFGLVLLGKRLEGPHPTPGVRAGSFIGAFTLFLLLLLTVGIGNNWLEPSDMSPVVGTVVTWGVVGGGLLFLWFWIFRKPGFLDWLVRAEENGWFHAASYKPNQGLRVRRGTVIGLLLVGFCGIYTLISHRMLSSAGWELRLPFSRQLLLEKPGEFVEPKTQNEIVTAVEQAKQRKEIKELKLLRGGEYITPRTADEIVLAVKQAQERGEIKDLKLQKPPDYVVAQTDEEMKQAVQQSRARESREWYYQMRTLPLMFNVNIVLPLLFGLAVGWFSWRVVNWPNFADFLIATEAEMNKVSWTTRKRLFQDTVVVLVTVLLLTVFLFIVDILWIKILSNPLLKVLEIDVQAERQRQSGPTPW